MRFVLLLFAFALPFLLPACVATDSGPQTLIVASDLDNLPFAGVADDGTPIGRDVEMMEMLAERTGHRLEWRRMPFDELLPAAEEGDVDVVCATLGITPERQQRVLFTESYFDTTLVAVVRNGIGEPRSLADLAGKRVAAGRGTTSERAVRRMLPRSTLLPESEADLPAARRLIENRIDCVVMDAPAADATVASSSGQLYRIPMALDAERYALALPQDRVDLCIALNMALRNLRLSGEMARLDERHGLSGYRGVR